MLFRSVYKAVILTVNEEGNQLNETILPLQNMFEYGRAQALANIYLNQSHLVMLQPSTRRDI